MSEAGIGKLGIQNSEPIKRRGPVPRQEAAGFRRDEFDEPPRKQWPGWPVREEGPAGRLSDPRRRAERRRGERRGPGVRGRRPADAAPAAPATGVAVVGPADGRWQARPPPAADAADGAPGPAVPVLPPDIQVVRFQGPEGMAVEVLAPAPTPVPPGDGGGILTAGLKRGVGYRLRISNIPERPGVEVFPVIEVVGHLHRPEGIDPGKYPIRVIFTLDDLDSVMNLGRLVTKVIYLEDPDQALPFRMAKDQIPVVSLNPTEHPLASRLGPRAAHGDRADRWPPSHDRGGQRGCHGRPRAGLGRRDRDRGLVRSSGRTARAARCPAGRTCTAPAPPAQPLLPRDEFLCDGGDRGIPAAVGPDGRLGGIEPRDAVVRFDIGLGDRVKPRILPTNVVCIYAPRFAEVRVTTGTNETVDVQGPRSGTSIETPLLARNLAEARRVVQNQSPELARNRARASGLKGREWIDEESNNRRAGGFENNTKISSNLQMQNLRAGPQPPEGRPDEGKDPPGGDQDRRDARRHGDRRRGRRGGQGVGTARDDRRRDAARIGPAWPSSSASAPSRPSRAIPSPT